MSGSLTHTPADVIQYLLIDLALGTIPTDEDDWPVYASRQGEAKDSCITVYNTEGVDEGRLQATGERQIHYGIQVRVRGSTFDAGWVKAMAIAVALDQSVHNTVVVVGASEYVVYAITRRGSVNDIGQEAESGRNVFTVNVLVALRQTA